MSILRLLADFRHFELEEMKLEEQKNVDFVFKFKFN